MDENRVLHSADGMLSPLPQAASPIVRANQYDLVVKRIELLLDGEYAVGRLRLTFLIQVGVIVCVQELSQI